MRAGFCVLMRLDFAVILDVLLYEVKNKSRAQNFNKAPQQRDRSLRKKLWFSLCGVYTISK